jgi:Raf kinase inhibitor-like YbhB/YbcL family protein
MILTSPSFEDGGSIPRKFTCDGGDINPELQIQNVPDAAQTLALILHDPDAPVAGGYTHWVVWNINPRTVVVKEESVPPHAEEGRNSAGRTGYMGPCPPSGVHHYQFKLFALDVVLDLSSDSKAEDLFLAIQTHVLQEAILVGTYGV